MLVYREKDNFIHKLHPFTIVAFVGVTFLLALVFSHPIYLLGLFLAVGLVIIAADSFNEWKIYLKFSVMMIVIIMFVNAIIVQNGETVLLTGPRVPVLGKIVVTMEALAFSLGMGIRLLVIISAFCLYTYAVHPDKVLKLFSRVSNKSVLIIALSTRLFPLMVKDFQRISEVQRCRGVKFDTGSKWKRAKNLLPIISVLLLSSLERSFQLAESMHARGYGSGSRSLYTRELWRPRDYIVLLSMVIAVLSGFVAVLKGWSTYSYYPKITLFNFKEMKAAVVVVLALLVPAILSWGWLKWPKLRSKI